MSDSRSAAQWHDGNGNCQSVHAVVPYFIARRRRIVIDTLIALTSLTVVLALIVAIDSRAGSQLARMISAPPSDGGVAVQLRDETMVLARSFWDMAQVHAPLTTFVGVGVLLMLFMLRMK